MSDNAKQLLQYIHYEYTKRLDEGKSPQNNAFSKDFFIVKYHYSNNKIDSLLSELRDYGYINKWVTGDFSLNID